MAREELVVAAVILKGGKVLVARRRSTKHPEVDGKWEYPGGRVMFGEMPADAVIREIREELRWAVRPTNLVHAVVNRYSHGDFIVLYYLCVLVTWDPVTVLLGESFCSVEWKTLEEVKLLDALNGTHEVATMLLSGRES